MTAGSSPVLTTKITNDSEKSKLDWVASIPVRVGQEEKSSSGPARRNEDLISYFLSQVAELVAKIADSKERLLQVRILS